MGQPCTFAVPLLTHFPRRDAACCVSTMLREKGTDLEVVDVSQIFASLVAKLSSSQYIQAVCGGEREFEPQLRLGTNRKRWSLRCLPGLWKEVRLRLEHDAGRTQSELETVGFWQSAMSQRRSREMFAFWFLEKLFDPTAMMAVFIGVSFRSALQGGAGRFRPAVPNPE
jgi:hypothetical protein